jgi:multidrug efflux pump subunit AcrA (membrane-fusion protein)
VVVGDPSRTELELQLPPDQAELAAEGDAVEFSPVGTASVAARATVVSRVPQVDPTTRTVRVRARISGETRGFYPGVFVEGTLTHGEARRSPAAPEAAVIRLGDEDVVFVRTSDTTFAARPVRLGRLDGGAYEVLEGLAAGEEVAVEGVFFLKSVLVAAEGEDG